MDINKVRDDFPILTIGTPTKPLIYLDSSASSQMPQAVINRIVRYQQFEHANIHRNAYYLGDLATAEYEAVRVKVQKFINAQDKHEIIFTSGATDSLNLVMQSYGRKFLATGDEVILSVMEHHSNIVPWQMLRDEIGIVIKVIPMNESGELLIDEYKKLFTSKTKIVGIVHASNALGTINPIREMVKIAHENGAVAIIDGAQAVAHIRTDVQELDCDFYAFSGHKMFGPTGVGVLYGKKELLDKMPPYRGGGEMILAVSFAKTIYNKVPHRFEAGTPPIMAVIALGAAIDYINSLGMINIEQYCHTILEYATAEVSKIKNIRIIGTAKNKVPVLSLVLDGIHPHDIGTILNDRGIAVRTGHHCAEPVMHFFQVPGTTRASFAIFNTKSEVDELVMGLNEVLRIFQ